MDCSIRRWPHPFWTSPATSIAKARVTSHPAAERLALLNHLQGGVVSRLSLFEENPRSFGDDVDTVQARLGEAVALAVSLCDTLGLDWRRVFGWQAQPGNGAEASPCSV